MNSTHTSFRTWAVLAIFALPFPAPAAITSLHGFAGGAADGRWPMGAPLHDGGLLYGMAQQGGVSNRGTIWRMRADGSGYTNLFSFDGLSGAYPMGRVIGSGGWLYGMTPRGGAWNNGVVFRIATNGGGFAVLHHFDATNRNDGAMPWGSLALSGSNLYGTTCFGGAADLGTVFVVSTNGAGYMNLHDFAGGSDDGKHPKGDVLVDGGSVYGMTSQGGTNDAGVIFRMAAAGGAYTNLHAFRGGSDDGGGPAGGLLKDGSYLFGLARGGLEQGGIAFSIHTNGGTLNLLHVFGGSATNGCDPFGSLVKHGSRLYGTTRYGGTNWSGVVFSLGGTYRHEFEWPHGEGEPLSDPVFVGDEVYGTTLRGGAAGQGTICKVAVDTTDTAAAWCAITWIENGAVGPVAAGDLSTNRIWVRHNTAVGAPDRAYVGYGSSPSFDDESWTWVPMTEYGMAGSDIEYTGILGRASAGGYYVAAKFVTGAHVYYAGTLGAWGDWSTALYTPNTWTVNPLGAPSPVVARYAGTNAIEVAFARDGAHWALVFRRTAGEFAPPQDGTAYGPGVDYGTLGECVYKGGADSFVDSNLAASAVYSYRVYTENYTYYSTGTAAWASTDPSADDDGDGSLNWHELGAGTDPSSAGSCFVIDDSGSRADAGRPVVVWASSAGKQYTILRATDLLAGFTNVAASGVAATVPVNSYTDTVDIVGALYYRVRVE